MPEFDPTRCAQCSNDLRADYLVVDQGTLSWCLCSWKCLGEFAQAPDTRKAADTAHGKLYRAWVRGPIRWYVYRTAGGALLRKVTEFLVPFQSLSGALSAAKAEAGANATEIPTRIR